jgi:hypothetical protein
MVETAKSSHGFGTRSRYPEDSSVHVVQDPYSTGDLAEGRDQALPADGDFQGPLCLHQKPRDRGCSAATHEKHQTP